MSVADPSKLFTPVADPASVGIPARAVLAFLDEIAANRVCMHGFVIVRRGRIAAEGYWAPYTASDMHRMYSISKSFVSIAIGLLIEDGALALETPVAELFPDRVSERTHRYIREATVRDLLIMATPHSSQSYTIEDPDWVETFFTREPSHPAGTIFQYDTAATVVLGTIVERITGAPFLESMRRRLLDPIGFSPDSWCVRTPEGTSWGGSGVICTLRDMAKVAWVCLDDGRWGDRQLLPPNYVREATAKQIDNVTSFGEYGYGYHIWRAAENGFAFLGMGSQLAYCFPDRDLLVACIADTQGFGPTGAGIVEPMMRHIHANAAEGTVPADKEAAAELTEKSASLALLPVDGATQTTCAERIDGTKYVLDANPMGIEWIRFTFPEEGPARLEYRNNRGHKTIKFGLGSVVSGHFPETHYFGTQMRTPANRPYASLASAAWVEPNKLRMLVYITDIYLGRLTATFAFIGADISVHMTKVAEWFLDEYQGFAAGTANE